MMRLRLRLLVAGFNQAVSAYTLARLEIAAAHPRIVTPPLIDRLGVPGRADDGARVWRAAIRQIRAADSYVRTGASAVARRHEAWSKLVLAFEALRDHAVSIEAVRTAGARPRRKRA
jgi:hypothetical protein